MDRTSLLRGLVVTALFLMVGALGAAAQTTHLVTQKGKRFSPSELVVQAGDTVAFRNDDRVVHNVFTASVGFEFNLKRQLPGAGTGVAFAQAGTVEVRCAIHPTMKLKITVK